MHGSASVRWRQTAGGRGKREEGEGGGPAAPQTALPQQCDAVRVVFCPCCRGVVGCARPLTRVTQTAAAVPFPRGIAHEHASLGACQQRAACSMQHAAADRWVRGAMPKSGVSRSPPISLGGKASAFPVFRYMLRSLWALGTTLHASWGASVPSPAACSSAVQCSAAGRLCSSAQSQRGEPAR